MPSSPQCLLRCLSFWHPSSHLLQHARYTIIALTTQHLSISSWKDHRFRPFLLSSPLLVEYPSHHTTTGYLFSSNITHTPRHKHHLFAPRISGKHVYLSSLAGTRIIPPTTCSFQLPYRSLVVFLLMAWAFDMIVASSVKRNIP